MAQCVYCHKDTQMFDRGQPLCISCSDEIDRGRQPFHVTDKNPTQQGTEKTDRAQTASIPFHAG